MISSELQLSVFGTETISSDKRTIDISGTLITLFCQENVGRDKIQDRQFSNALIYPVYYLKVIIKLLFILSIRFSKEYFLLGHKFIFGGFKLYLYFV